MPTAQQIADFERLRDVIRRYKIWWLDQLASYTLLVGPDAGVWLIGCSRESNIRSSIGRDIERRNARGVLMRRRHLIRIDERQPRRKFIDRDVRYVGLPRRHE